MYFNCFYEIHETLLKGILIYTIGKFLHIYRFDGLCLVDVCFKHVHLKQMLDCALKNGGERVFRVLGW